MLLKEETLNRMIRLGLSVLQSKVYLALLTMGKGDAKHVSNLSGVPRQDIYRVLTELYKIGLADKILASPNEYSACPLEDAVSHLIQRKEKEMAEMKEVGKVLISEMAPTTGANQETKRDEEKFPVMTCSRDAIIRSARDRIENTERSIDSISTFKRMMQSLHILNESWQKALVRGVVIRWLTEKPESGFALSRETLGLLGKPNLKTKYIAASRIESQFSIFDKRSLFCLLGFDAETDMKLNFGSKCRLLIEDKSIAKTYSSRFEELWRTATTYKLGQ